MTRHFFPNGVGDKDFAKIIEQVKAAELVQVNQWPASQTTTDRHSTSATQPPLDVLANELRG